MTVQGQPGFYSELEASLAYILSWRAAKSTGNSCLQQAIKITMKRKYAGNFSLKSFMVLNKCQFFVCLLLPLI